MCAYRNFRSASSCNHIDICRISRSQTIDEVLDSCKLGVIERALVTPSRAFQWLVARQGDTEPWRSAAPEGATGAPVQFDNMSCVAIAIQTVPDTPIVEL